MLVVPHRKKLVLSTPRIDEVLAAIPHAKAARIDNEDVVVVDHGVDETTVLNNMGFEGAPAPILHYYDWPGRFAPMEHQLQTAAFLSLRRRALCLNSPGCVDADTEYLSPNGWRRIADYAGGQVAQFDPDTAAVSFVDAEYVKLPCDLMVQVKTKYGVDQVLSPEHRCLVYSKYNQDKYEVLDAAELHARERTKIPRSRRTISFSQAAIKTTFDYDGPGIALSPEALRVQVAVIADGYFPSRSTRRCIVRIKKERKKSRLRALLRDAGIPYAERKVAPEGFATFTFTAPRREKEFGPEWFACTAAQIRLVVDEVPHWDSNVPPNPNRGWRFSSHSRASADFVQFACAASGHTARVLTLHRVRSSGPAVEYCVQVRPGVRMVGLKGGGSTGTTRATLSSDGYKYCFKVPSTFLLLRRNGCVFTTGNTGKSLSALWAADHLLTVGAVRKVLIIAPLSTLKVVWGKEIMHHLCHRRFEIITGARDRRIKLAKESTAEFLIINHDGFTTHPEALRDCDLVIYDEATALKTPGSKRYKTFAKFVSAYNPRLWMLTGTPIAQSPVDAWTLAKLVNSPTVPPTFLAFKDMVMRKVTTFKWVPREDAVDICRQVLQPSIRFTLSECVDLPETSYITRECDLTAEQIAAYKELQDHAMIMRDNITAANAAVLVAKLLQVCCGVAYDSNGQAVAFDDKSRVDALMELIEEIGDKVIVFVPLRSVQRRLLEVMNAAKIDAAVVNGDTSTTERNKIFYDFQNTDRIQVLLAHPKVAAHGLTLTRASSIVWYAPIYSLEMYEQANARIRRLTTEGKTVVYHLAATGFEKSLYKRLLGKQKLLMDFLDMVQGINE